MTDKIDDLTTQSPAVAPNYRGPVEVIVLVTATVATIVLLGWVFHNEPMKRMVNGLTSMNPLTAIGFAAAALELWLIKDGRPRGRRAVAATVLPLFTLLVGGSKLIDLATGSLICPDTLFFASQLDVGQLYPSRMAPNVAASFVILSVAYLASDRPRLPAFLHPQWLVTPVLCAAFIAMIGYAYNTSGLYKYRQFIPMALNSAICLVLLSIALILSRPDQGYLKRLPRGSPGARSYSHLLPACILIPAVLGGCELYATGRGWLSDNGSGISIVAALTILALSVLAFLSSAAINQADAVRRQADAQLRALVQELDRGNKALVQEVAERKRLEEEAKHQASHDPLTGLPNRLLFVDRLQHTISQAVRHNTSCALFYVDIDNFKPVNDRYGHQAGDALLISLAHRLKDAVREVDMVARLGGDEFAVVMDAPATHTEAQILAKRMCDAVTAPHRLALPEPIEVTVGISVGIAVFPGHAADLDSLVRLADTAMYQAKVDGKTQGRSTNIEFAVMRQAPAP